MFLSHNGENWRHNWWRLTCLVSNLSVIDVYAWAASISGNKILCVIHAQIHIITFPTLTNPMGKRWSTMVGIVPDKKNAVNSHSNYPLYFEGLTVSSGKMSQPVAIELNSRHAIPISNYLFNRADWAGRTQKSQFARWFWTGQVANFRTSSFLCPKCSL